MIAEEVKPKLKPGAMVTVKEKTGQFKGLIISRKHGSEPGATFTVRATVGDVGVEKIYPLHSPAIVSAKVMSAPNKVHRSKLYFVRKLSKKKIRKKIGVAA